MTYATDETVIATGLVLARAALFDDYFGNEDDNRTEQWAIAIQKYNLEQPDLLDAVTTFYAGTPGGRLNVGELIRLARQSRQDSTMRQEANERAARGITAGLTPIAAIAPPDPQFGGLTIAGIDGDPVRSAYAGAVDRECGTCGAKPGDPCVNRRSGALRRIPCLGRLKELK